MRKLFLILIPILALACQDNSDDECHSASIIGSQQDCQNMGDDRQLILMLLDHSDTVLALYPKGLEVPEVGVSLNVQFNQVNSDSLVCKAFVSPKLLVEITNLNCN